MTQTTELAETTGGGTSTSFTVGTTPAKVGLFSTAGEFPSVQAQVMEVTPGGDNPVFEAPSMPLVLTRERRSAMLRAPGTYKVVLPATATKCGVFTDA